MQRKDRVRWSRWLHLACRLDVEHVARVLEIDPSVVESFTDVPPRYRTPDEAERWHRMRAQGMTLRAIARSLGRPSIYRPSCARARRPGRDTRAVIAAPSCRTWRPADSLGTSEQAHPTARRPRLPRRVDRVEAIGPNGHRHRVSHTAVAAPAKAGRSMGRWARSSNGSPPSATHPNG